jgi:hypothetical protein
MMENHNVVHFGLLSYAYVVLYNTAVPPIALYPYGKGEIWNLIFNNQS